MIVIQVIGSILAGFCLKITFLIGGDKGKMEFGSFKGFWYKGILVIWGFLGL